MNFCALALLLLAAHGSSASAAEPRRILPLTPSLAEMTAQLLGENLDRIVGVTEFTDFPEALRSRPSVGSYARLQVERIVMLKPDLVLATSDGNPKDQILKLEKLGIKIKIVDVLALSDIPKAYLALGEILGRQEKARTIADDFDVRLASLTSAPRGKKLFLQLGEHPLIGVGPGTFLGQAVEKMGYGNILPSTLTPYPRLQKEFVLKAKPSAIVLLGLNTDSKAIESARKNWKDLGLHANHLVAIHGSELMRPTARLLDGLSALKKELEQIP
jgi:iron complex transport system substrate-binding protein